MLLLAMVAGYFYFAYNYRPAHEVRVYYNKDEALNKQIVQIIRNADKFVYFGIYTFTRNDIKDALLAAKYRGLEVKGITDREQYEQIDLQKKIINELRKAGIAVAEQDHAAIMHTKAVVTDKAYASGSFNWTAAATNLNDEILEVGRDENIRKQYEQVLREIIKKYSAK